MLPHLASVVVTAVDTTGPVVVVHARTRLDKASACIGCGSGSDWVRSRYMRRLADTVIGGRPARIELQVRRLYCENPLCRQGIIRGAPDAIQVSDRFHLWQGLSRRVQQIATAGCLPAAAPEPAPVPAAPAGTEATPAAASPAASHARRLFETVHALTDTGRAYNSVARELGLNWRTVRKYATASNWQVASFASLGARCS